MTTFDNTVEIRSEVKLQKTKYINYLQQAFKLGIIKEKSTVKYKNVIAKVSILDEQAVLFYGDIPYYSFYKFMLTFDKLFIDKVPYYYFQKELKTKECQQLNPKIFVGIEGTGISGVTSGDDKRLLMEWELTEEASNELHNSVCDDILRSKQILYHWLFEWVLNPWGSNIQMAFNKIFYDAQFPCNQWNSYNRKGGPQMFASSYDDITTRIDEILSNNMKLLPNPSIENAIDWIKDRKGFNGIVMYWVDVDRIKSMRYQDLVSEGDDLWKGVVVASRCSQVSEVDRDDFVYRYQLSNLRQILTEWEDHGGEDVEGSWQNVIPSAQWFEPIRHLQLAIKTPEAIDLMNSYCVGIIYFHTK
ncbi:hypothetical protein RhiirA5_419241 [Rhizophagus irregularis]|uniref:Uncharacterized protein n=3 Tax=Rhizophagus irregularis TaxID=588596 RepID=A0A2I1EQM4_9GLOM|nr:hypothetical protein RhiirA5_419241 [Rhizophagus irregularis]PKC64525.1 hypothetical protein RhiirA1_462297 [Rhizophagus irregularis]PKY24431.1 hypothetical protein RhiirB3_438970 [Rhizophagus irregularis]